jgi:predicted NACHT family NTPase
VGDRNLVITGANADAIRELLGTRSRIEQQLLQAVKDEVETRLKYSLHNAVLINLGMENQLKQVQHPWSSDIKMGNKPSEPIPKDWQILQVFDEAQGKLLILGKPGAGKTTTMLELAQSLVTRAEQG